jgi:hypothetical protein
MPCSSCGGGTNYEDKKTSCVMNKRDTRLLPAQRARCLAQSKVLVGARGFEPLGPEPSNDLLVCSMNKRIPMRSMPSACPFRLLGMAYTPRFRG